MAPSLRAVAVLLLLVAAAPANAQQTPPPGLDMAAMERLQEAAERMMNPALTALDHRAELGLSGEQVESLERLATEVRVAISDAHERMSTAQARITTRLQLATDELEESALRSLYMQKADAEADLAISTHRARAAMARTLDPMQQSQLDQLVVGAMMRMMQGGGAPPGVVR